MHETQTYIPVQQTDEFVPSQGTFARPVRDTEPPVGVPLFAPQPDPYGFDAVAWANVPVWETSGPAPQDPHATDGCPAPPPAGPAVSHARTRQHRPGVHRADSARLRRWARWISATVAALTAVMISVLGAMVCYAPLRALASQGASGGLADLWPLLIYGPWMVASLAILRASANGRRVAHSWCVVILFSALAVVLCVAHAPLTLSAISVAGLPPITALLSFHQLVRQIEPPAPPLPAPAEEPGNGHHRKPPSSRP
ncbi:DUF2637 domain-containing protein [Streptomyces benahoarensis]|uniref:DUF2637 domain-containing protein n=1 Tax=Streptomyces benahoarensis TaxID=2595054 RepID=UPI002034DF0B|nr:DUF2637 domain-containing protein [Streptomyces benahoarensis]